MGCVSSVCAHNVLLALHLKNVFKSLNIHTTAAYNLDVQLNHHDKPNNIFRSQGNTLKAPVCSLSTSFPRE